MSLSGGGVLGHGQAAAVATRSRSSHGAARMELARGPRLPVSCRYPASARLIGREGSVLLAAGAFASFSAGYRDVEKKPSAKGAHIVGTQETGQITGTK